MMFIKFGFGRTTSDAGIDIRAGRLTREEGVELVKKYDGRFPEQYLPDFLEYFEMTEGEFWAVVDSFANTEVLEKVDGRWRLKPAMVRGLEKGGEFSLQDTERHVRRSSSEPKVIVGARWYLPLCQASNRKRSRKWKSCLFLKKRLDSITRLNW